jgi:hypothetical protein
VYRLYSPVMSTDFTTEYKTVIIIIIIIIIIISNKTAFVASYLCPS